MKTIDKLIGLDDFKLGKQSYFTSNILQSLLEKQVLNMLGKDSPDIEDMIEMSVGGQFGKDKKMGFDINVGPSKKWKFNLSKKF